MPEEICLNLSPKKVKGSLVPGKYDHVVSIPEVMAHTPVLLQPVVEPCQVVIGKILAQIIADRKSGCAVDDLVQQPEKAFVLEFPAQ